MPPKMSRGGGPHLARRRLVVIKRLNIAKPKNKLSQERRSLIDLHAL